MNTQTVSIYNVCRPSSRLMEIPILLGFNLLLVTSAYISINLPFSPVPITGQTFGVLLIAMILGRVRGAAVVCAYLLEGAAGLPVFAGGKAGLVTLFGPTGGYLLGFAVAAFVAGSLADRGWDRSYLKSIIAMTIGTAIIFLFGLSWLAKFVPELSLLTVGLTPFVPGAVLKISLAAVILPSLWKFIGQR
ncbi:MAG: biotin transporter BioY [candidate division Zixibacteria bacterium]|nr:biotin transporter BioY [candidate division Zixibacteria bacterium]MBU1470641.1 biotin transporter BioY [candidate division Zixibacteria bacterium]MBU2624138.1 biotin transporter BioY [candidate division Zixibacteria bacterium]